MYLHGGDYCPEQWLTDFETIKNDIKKLKEANINCITLGMFSWSTLEKQEGVYETKWFYDTLKIIEENNIQVILGTATAARPHWLAQRYPTTSRVLKNGQRELSGGRHNHCMSDKKFRELARKIIIEQLKIASTFNNIHSIHLNNEVNGACYCESCVQEFRNYLLTKYEKIEKLNKCWWNTFWSHDYNNFNEIQPPLEFGENSNTSLLINWDEFTTNMHANYIKFEKDIIKEFSNFNVSTNFCGTPFTTKIDYYRLAKEVDYISYDVYPYWQRRDNFEVAITAKKDLLSQRDLDSNKDFYIMESSPGGADWRPCTIVKSCKLHGASTFLQILCGAKSTLYFQLKQSRGNNEKFHGNVLDINSDTTGRVYNYVKDFGEKISQLNDFHQTRDVKEVAIYLSWQSHRALNYSSGPRNQGLHAEKLYNDLIRYFNNVGLNCSFVYDETKLEEFQYIILPFGYTLTNSFNEKLRKIDPLKVIAFPLLGYANSDDLLHQGKLPYMVTDLFGVNITEVTAIVDEDKIFDEENEYNTVAEVIVPTSAIVLNTFDDEVLNASITENKVGMTDFYYIASIPEFDSLINIFDKIFEQKYDNNINLIKNKCYIDNDLCQYVINFGDTNVLLDNILWKSSGDSTNVLSQYDYAICKL